MWMKGNPPNYTGQQNYTGGYPPVYQQGEQAPYPPVNQPMGQQGYPPPQSPYQQMNVNNQPPYQTAQSGYQQQPAYPPQNQPYPPQNQPYPPQQTGYQQTGYQQQWPPRFEQQQQQPVNTAYQQMNGMGRTGYGNGYQTGYGYPPANQMQDMDPPSKPRPDPIIAVKIALYGGLFVLFALAMLFASVPALKWVFVALAVLGIAAMWMREIVPENTRFTLSAVYGALAVVALVSALTGAAPADKQASSGNAGGGTSQSANQGGAGQIYSQTSTPTPSPTPTQNVNANEMTRQLESFFYFWQNNQIDQMVELCAPSWRASVESPSTALFGLLANRKMIEYDNIRVTNGSDNDTTRTVMIDARVSKYTGSDATKYRFKIVMKKENDRWYIDPNSLDSQEAAEETPTPTPTVTPTPTPYIEINNSTKLYYNPDGGSKYHADAYCPSAAERYLPFKGTFTYGELNNSPYSGLEPCNRCNAPLRQ